MQVRGDQEIHRDITATETTEMEHKGKTQERVVNEPQVRFFLLLLPWMHFFQYFQKYLTSLIIEVSFSSF